MTELHYLIDFAQEIPSKPCIATSTIAMKAAHINRCTQELP